jgi:transcriptional regulator with XRE-family HTH domain
VETQGCDRDSSDRSANDADPSTQQVLRSIPAISLRYWRTLAGLTQPQLGARAGVARETIARIENGRPASRAVLTCLADALQLEPTVLASPPPTTPDNACDGVQDAATTVTDRVQPAPSLSAPISAVHLRRCRTQANLTQPQLARRAGIARETIARIENGRPARRAVFLRLAIALRVAPSMLTGSAELDRLTGETYRTCNRCATLRPLAGVHPNYLSFSTST